MNGWLLPDYEGPGKPGKIYVLISACNRKSTEGSWLRIVPEGLICRQGMRYCHCKGWGERKKDLNDGHGWWDGEQTRDIQ